MRASNVVLSRLLRVLKHFLITVHYVCEAFKKWMNFAAFGPTCHHLFMTRWVSLEVPAEILTIHASSPTLHKRHLIEIEARFIDLQQSTWHMDARDLWMQYFRRSCFRSMNENLANSKILSFESCEVLHNIYSAKLFVVHRISCYINFLAPPPVFFSFALHEAF